MNTTATTQTSSPVHLIAEGGVLTITLNRPKANAIDVSTSQALYSAFETLQNESSLHAAILTGTGRFFSAGWDLNAANNGEAITANHGKGGFAGLTEYFDLDKPVIAAVNGLAFGGGFELALAADFIVCSDNAIFSLPEIKLGMLADSGGIFRLPKRIAPALARELILTGRQMGAEEALRCGLVNSVTSSDKLLTCAKDLANSIAENAPLAVKAAKQVLREAQDLAIPNAFKLLRSAKLTAYEAMLQSSDAKEGPRAFAEKRQPKWQGK